MPLQDGFIGRDDFMNFFTEVMELADEARPEEALVQSFQGAYPPAEEAKRKTFPSLEA